MSMLEVADNSGMPSLRRGGVEGRADDIRMQTINKNAMLYPFHVLNSTLNLYIPYVYLRNAVQPIYLYSQPLAIRPPQPLSNSLLFLHPNPDIT
jgi:hypothetical protein